MSVLSRPTRFPSSEDDEDARRTKNREGGDMRARPSPLPDPQPQGEQGDGSSSEYVKAMQRMEICMADMQRTILKLTEQVENGAKLHADIGKRVDDIVISQAHLQEAQVKSELTTMTAVTALEVQHRRTNDSVEESAKAVTALSNMMMKYIDRTDALLFSRPADSTMTASHGIGARNSNLLIQEPPQQEMVDGTNNMQLTAEPFRSSGERESSSDIEEHISHALSVPDTPDRNVGRTRAHELISPTPPRPQGSEVMAKMSDHRVQAHKKKAVAKEDSVAEEVDQQVADESEQQGGLQNANYNFSTGQC